MGEHVRRGYEQMGEAVAESYRRAEGFVAENPGPSLLAGFCLGFGLGVVVAMALAPEEEPETRYARFLDSLRHLPERFGRS